MCLLTFLDNGVMPDSEALLNGAAVNDDGHGFAIVTGRRLIVRHALNGPELIETFAAARRRYPHGPALFHSRFATHGRHSLDNCHPFTVGGDDRTVLAHNGVLPAIVQPSRGDLRSDTRIAAEDFLPALGSLRSRRIRLTVERWMTSTNKIVILTVDRRFTDQAYILNEAAGTWVDGIWYSNAGYLPPAPPCWADEDPEYDWHAERHGGRYRCIQCDAFVTAGDSECRACGWCFDCWSPAQACLCYPVTQPIGRDADR